MSPKKRERAEGNGRKPSSAVATLQAVHEGAIERLKASAQVVLFLPKPMHDDVEAKAKEWKDANKHGEAHPMKVSCSTVRFRALLEQINAELSKAAPVLAIPAPMAAVLVEVVEACKGTRGAHDVISDISLMHAKSRDAHESPYAVTFTFSALGLRCRDAIFAIAQPGAPEANTRERKEKIWEVRCYRPRHGGPLMKEIRKDEAK